jgi:chemotaxis protein MotA
MAGGWQSPATGRGEFRVDLGTVGGFVLAISMIGGALMIMTSHGSGQVNLGAFVDVPALMLIGGGCFAVALVGFPIKQALNAFKLIAKVFYNKPEHLNRVIEEMVGLAEIARRDGLLALETKAAEIEDPFVALGVQMAVDGTRPEIIAEVLRTDIESMQARHRDCKKMIELVGRCGPAFGMVATLLGLILMLGNLSDPDSIGPSMAVALVGTMYGVLAANLIAIPFGEKLGGLSAEESLAKEIVLRGVLGIQSGDNPRTIQQKLTTYLPPRLRPGAHEKAPHASA